MTPVHGAKYVRLFYFFFQTFKKIAEYCKHLTTSIKHLLMLIFVKYFFIFAPICIKNIYPRCAHKNMSNKINRLLRKNSRFSHVFLIKNYQENYVGKKNVPWEFLIGARYPVEKSFEDFELQSNLDLDFFGCVCIHFVGLIRFIQNRRNYSFSFLFLFHGRGRGGK